MGQVGGGRSRSWATRLLPTAAGSSSTLIIHRTRELLSPRVDSQCVNLEERLTGCFDGWVGWAEVNKWSGRMLRDSEILSEWRKLQMEMGDLLFEEIKQGSLTLNARTMRFQYFTIGSRPQSGYRLVFGLHGGGGCTTEVNNQQWNNHLHIYDSHLPEGTIWFVPRSCEEAPDMWWKPYLIEFLEVVVRAFVLKDLVNADRVFVTGYSAGGDGVYHLAPMMADFWAGAAMMAGHPNKVQLQNVRNTSFSIQVGGKDNAYDRNSLAREYINHMEQLQQRYGGFKLNYCQVHEHCQHWMNRKDAEILPFFLNEIRNPYPDLILFKQHPRTQKRYFYYVEVDPTRHLGLLIVRKQGNTFRIDSELMNVTIYINHLMVDVNQDVVIYHNNLLAIRRKPVRNGAVVSRSIRERMDPSYIFEDSFTSTALQLPQTTPVMVGQQQPSPRRDREERKDDICCHIY